MPVWEAKPLFWTLTWMGMRFYGYGNNKGNLILHRGGRDFEALDANPLLVEHGFADLDNDGFPELWMLRSGFMQNPSFMSSRATTPILRK